MAVIIVFVIALVGLLIGVSIFKNGQRRKQQLETIRQKWGKPLDMYRNMQSIGAYLRITVNEKQLSPSTAEDIDLDKVFAYADRTNSKPGQQYLYVRLNRNNSTANDALFIDHQIDTLPTNRTELEQYELKLSELGNADAYYIPQLFREQELFFKPLTIFYIRISGITVTVLIILLSLIHSQVYFLALMAMLITNTIIHYATKSKVLQYTHSLPQLLRLIEVAKWFRRKSTLPPTTEVSDAIDQAAKLNRSLRYVSINEGLNDPTDLTYALFELLKMLLLLEPLMFIASINRINQYRSQLQAVFEYIAHIDFLISIRSLREGLPYYSKPVFTKAGELDVKELYHPLIDGCVANSISSQADKGVLITGSNMSGKTTFIRSVAINAVLAQSMFTSCSKSYRAPWLNIHTSIRISDAIEEHKSYFQAETISVLNIIRQCDADKPARSLVIIDEIFRGTNTIERIAAAKAVLAYLTANGHFVFVSTHDLELAELLGTDYAVYSFEEKVVDGARLVFDYHIKPGLLKNKNGIALLNALGYPAAVVNDAGIVSEQLRQKYQL